MKIERSFLFLGFIAIIGMLIWGAILYFTWNDTEGSNELLIDLGKTGASLSLLTVIGGLVQWIINERDSKRQKLDDQMIFYRNILADFKSVYDKVERARLLIEAHRSAKTYGEQMRALIEGVVILHNIKRALNPGFPLLYDKLKPSIDEMNEFIKQLLSEFKENYKQISVLQQIDESNKKSLINHKVSLDSPEVNSDEIPSSAWNKIEQLENLKKLRDDDLYEYYESEFLDHLHRASEIIRRKLPIEELK